jgi:hypothetical protein
MIPFDKFSLKIEDLAKEISDPNNVRKLLVLGGKDLEGRLKRRIFNKGLDTNDSQIGDYKKTKKGLPSGWAKKRSEAGRQIGYVDLEFTGELRKSIQVVESGRDVFLAIINDEDYKKAKGNEKNYKTTIFEPTVKEEIAVQRYIDDLISEDIERILLKL